LLSADGVAVLLLERAYTQTAVVRLELASRGC
jgi:hypothetical protein